MQEAGGSEEPPHRLAGRVYSPYAAVEHSRKRAKPSGKRQACLRRGAVVVPTERAHVVRVTRMVEPAAAASGEGQTRFGADRSVGCGGSGRNRQESCQHGSEKFESHRNAPCAFQERSRP